MLVLTAEGIVLFSYWDRPLTDAGSVAERLTTPSWEVEEGWSGLDEFLRFFFANSPFDSNSVWTFYANGSMIAGDVEGSGNYYDYGSRGGFINFGGPSTRQWSVDGDVLALSRQTGDDGEVESYRFRILQCTASDLELEELDGSANEGTGRTLALTSRSRVIMAGTTRVFVYGFLLVPFAAVVIAHAGSRRLARHKLLVFVACWLGTVLIGLLGGNVIGDGRYPYSSHDGALFFAIICVIPGLINGVVAMLRPPLDVPVSLYKKYNRSE